MGGTLSSVPSPLSPPLSSPLPSIWYRTRNLKSCCTCSQTSKLSVVLNIRIVHQAIFCFNCISSTKHNISISAVCYSIYRSKYINIWVDFRYIPGSRGVYQRRCCVCPVLVWNSCKWQQTFVAPPKFLECADTLAVVWRFHQPCHKCLYICYSISVMKAQGLVVEHHRMGTSSSLALWWNHRTQAVLHFFFKQFCYETWGKLSIWFKVEKLRNLFSLTPICIHEGEVWIIVCTSWRNCTT